MSHPQQSVASHILTIDHLQVERRPDQRRKVDRFNDVVGPWSYRAKLGKGTIRLSSIEFRILMFLASKPYRAFTKRRIAAAVSTETQPVTAETLGRYVRSLRGQLGFYSDYIQSVAYIGYRFKA
jgi:DNA-binding response OmpR family regulator